jgi:hypothetical protein
MAKRLVKPSAPTTAKASDKPSTGRTTSKRSKAAALEPNEDDVRMHAYHLYLERGAGPGHALDDWIAAEKALRH